MRTSGHTFRSTDIGAVLDLMIHDLDLVLSLAKSEVVEVDGIGSTIFGPHEDMAHAHLRFANGCIANLNTSRTSFQSQRTMQIVTDRTYVGIDFAAPSAKVVRPSKQVLRGEIEVQGLSFEEREHLRHTLFTDLLPVRDIPLAATNAIQEEQRDFAQAILEGRAPLVCGRQALKCLTVAERILQQIANSQQRSLRRTVPVPDLMAKRRKAG